MSILDEVAAERVRQVNAEGFDAANDDRATRCQLAIAAMAYVQAASCAQRDIAASLPPPSYWPWDKQWWRPKDPRRNLIKAAALIVAEIERLDRHVKP